MYRKNERLQNLKMFALLVFSGLFLTACGGDLFDFDVPRAGNPPITVDPPVIQSGSISGKVIDFNTGQGVPNANISTGTVSGTTATDGSYTLNDVPFDERVIVNVSANNYADQSNIINISSREKDVLLTINMLPADLNQAFDPTLSQNLVAPNSTASVSVDANSLIGNANTLPTGDVRALLTVIDPSTNPELMPGDFTDLQNRLIETFGAIHIALSDLQGNPLSLSSGSTATVRIPVPGNTINPPATIPLYFYDRATGLWVNEGTATLFNPGGEAFYEGTIARLATWNAGQILETVAISGCVVDVNGNPISGITVKTIGSNYAGSASTTTNSDGTFGVAAKSNAEVFLFATNGGEKSNTLQVPTSGVDQNISSCLAFGEKTISIKLTWGQNPSDLDSHLIGPGSYHIYFANRGALNNAPFAQLDVDDLFSFGPEVLTVTKFEIPGTYTYSVHDFSGTSTITNSPARVELNVNGNVTLFTPPVGQGPNDETWNVFELVVDANQNVTVNTLNTWQVAAP